MYLCIFVFMYYNIVSFTGQCRPTAAPGISPIISYPNDNFVIKYCNSNIVIIL